MNLRAFQERGRRRGPTPVPLEHGQSSPSQQRPGPVSGSRFSVTIIEFVGGVVEHGTATGASYDSGVAISRDRVTGLWKKATIAARTAARCTQANSARQRAQHIASAAAWHSSTESIMLTAAAANSHEGLAGDILIHSGSVA